MDNNSRKNNNYNTRGRTALVTGATSGLGFEASALLVEKYGFDRVIITGRTQEKASLAKEQLVERTGVDKFETLVLDTAEIESATKAFEVLAKRAIPIDFLLLNAGLVKTKFEANSQGYNLVYAASLFGHHILATSLLNSELLTKDARIVIAGSEAARADLSQFKSEFPDYYEIAKEKFEGDISNAIIANARGELMDSYNMMNEYGAAKGLVAWWAAALSRRVPKGIGVFAVSPGSVPGTKAQRNMPFIMRKVMLPIMSRIGHRFGMAQSVSEGASRYVDVVYQDLESTNGSFFASAPTKMVGPMEIQYNTHLLDKELQEAGWKALVEMTHAKYQPIAVEASD